MSEQEQRRMMAATILAGMLARDDRELSPEAISQAVQYADEIIDATREPKV